MTKPVLVIKLGSAVITNSNGQIDESIIEKLAVELSALSKQYRIAIVSSGAVGSGKAFIKNYKGTLIERKAAAAVGNPILIQLYHRYFFAHGITVAQALCERHHFSHREQFLQLKETFTEFWKNHIIPVVNENDLVSNIELKFSDNDELATLIAIGFDAAALVIFTSVGGFMDANKTIIPQINRIDEKILGAVTSEKSAIGLGGMLSKLTFTRLATSLGIKVMITGMDGQMPVQAALNGESGTTFTPQSSDLKARKKWLASGSVTLGGIMVDNGAEKALLNHKSLLTVGIVQVSGSFSAGEVVQLINEKNQLLGVARIKIAAVELPNLFQHKNTVAAHADDIVLL